MRAPRDLFSVDDDHDVEVGGTGFEEWVDWREAHKQSLVLKNCEGSVIRHNE